MPRAFATSEELEKESGKVQAAHISLSIHRKNGGVPGHSVCLQSSVQPYITALHVIRTNHTPPPTPSADALPPDAPNSTHYAWPAPPAILPASETSAYDGAFFWPSEPGFSTNPNTLTLRAWHGPRWGSMINGVDDTIDFVAVVEFEGGIFLKSKTHRLYVTT